MTIDKSARGMLAEMRRDINLLQRRLGKGIISGLGRGSIAQRDADFPPPSTVAEQVYLANSQLTWINTDTGWTESYYAPTGSAGLTVRGLASGAPAGWYPVGDDGPYGKLMAAGGQAHGNGSYFTNWNNFGTGGSWRSSTLIDRPLPGDLATIRTNLAGRYRCAVSMTLPSGAGTGVWRFAYLDGVNPAVIRDQPAPLLSGYGQIATFDFKNILLFPTGRCYFQTIAASWTVGDAESFMTMEYIGPPLVTS